MQIVVPKNDYVKNKKRQDHIGVFCVTREPLANSLDGAGYLLHTINPQKINSPTITKLENILILNIYH